jgi:hypothetical protein
MEPTNHAEHETIEITQGIWGNLQSCQTRVNKGGRVTGLPICASMT